MYQKEYVVKSKRDSASQNHKIFIKKILQNSQTHQNKTSATKIRFFFIYVFH